MKKDTLIGFKHVGAGIVGYTIVLVIVGIIGQYNSTVGIGAAMGTIIMLTAKGEESDVVLGLNLGVDDYVTKPFSIKELLARAAAFLRRTRQTEKDMYEFADYCLDVPARKLTRRGDEIKLSPKEFKLLELFVKRPHRALTRDEILNKVWGYDCFVGPRSIDRFVTTLRNKIEPDPHNPTFIRTIREIGYKFTPPE